MSHDLVQEHTAIVILVVHPFLVILTTDINP